jgi:hypothetical protein
MTEVVISTGKGPAVVLCDPNLAGEFSREQAAALNAGACSLMAWAVMAQGAAVARLTILGPPMPDSPAPASSPVFISPVEAARLAGLITDETDETRKRALKRIYEWAKGRAWAKRPNRKTLVIDRDAFVRWLASR